MKIILSLFLGLLCLSTTLTSSATFAQEGGRIVAVVNDDVITRHELDARFDLIRQNARLPNNPDILQRVRQRALSNLIEETLQIQEASRYEIVISNDDILEGMRQLARQNNMSLDQFAQSMKDSGIEPSTLARQIRAQMAWSRLVQQRVRPRIQVSDDDVQAEIDRLEEQAGKTEYLLAEIFLPLPEQQKDNDIKRLANDIANEIKQNGAPFPALAQQFSQSASAAQGGMLGWVTEDQLSDAVREAASRMSKGNVSNPIRSQTGYHILLLQDKRQIRFAPAELDMQAVRSQIFNKIGTERLEREAVRYLRDLRNSAFIERRL